MALIKLAGTVTERGARGLDTGVKRQIAKCPTPPPPRIANAPHRDAAKHDSNLIPWWVCVHACPAVQSTSPLLSYPPSVVGVKTFFCKTKHNQYMATRAHVPEKSRLFFLCVSCTYGNSCFGDDEPTSQNSQITRCRENNWGTEPIGNTDGV